MAKVGRPSKYSKELADKICELLSQGLSLKKICLRDDIPEGTTIFRWLAEKEEFRDQYAKAKENSADALNEEILDLGDKAIEHSETADPKASGAVVSAYKLKADNLKWYMSKMKPKKYGDKLDVTSGGEKLPTPIYGGNSTAK